MNPAILSDKIIHGYEISKNEAMNLFNVDLQALLEESRKIMHHYHGNRFDLCTIINGKSGKCPEDCKYCGQSVHYPCEVKTYPLLTTPDIVPDAVHCYNKGIHRYSIVTSGRRMSNEEVTSLADSYKSIGDACNIKRCASHGLLSYDDFIKLKASGVTRYHNNLETSKRHFPKICTTHTYDDKVEVIRAAQKAGLQVCSGGIIGVGESNEDRVDMALELRDLGVESVPLNLLNPIKNTPLENQPLVSEDEFYRVCAIYRFIHPKSVIRLAGGRRLLSDKGYKAFKYCVNGTITGELLTTSGNDTASDITMLQSLGYDISAR